MLENFIDKHLKKQGFVRVPESWTKDYQELVQKYKTLSLTVRDISREYNSALEEILEAKGPNYARSALNDLDINTDGIKDEEVLDVYMSTFGVSFDDDTDEEVK